MCQQPTWELQLAPIGANGLHQASTGRRFGRRVAQVGGRYSLQLAACWMLGTLPQIQRVARSVRPDRLTTEWPGGGAGSSHRTTMATGTAMAGRSKEVVYGSGPDDAAVLKHHVDGRDLDLV